MFHFPPSLSPLTCQSCRTQIGIFLPHGSLLPIFRFLCAHIRNAPRHVHISLSSDSCGHTIISLTPLFARCHFRALPLSRLRPLSYFFCPCLRLQSFYFAICLKFGPRPSIPPQTSPHSFDRDFLKLPILVLGHPLITLSVSYSFDIDNLVPTRFSYLDT